MQVSLDVKDHITGTCLLEYYRDSALWYRTEGDLLFPVPVADIEAGAQFLKEERAIMLMRWIRKHLVSLKEEMRV
jgi:hypothetical protein